jgi:hypothetical protein
LHAPQPAVVFLRKRDLFPPAAAPVAVA